MWYTGQGEKQRTSEAAARDALTPASGSVGVAVSGDGVNWTRGAGSVVGTKGGYTCFAGWFDAMRARFIVQSSAPRVGADELLAGVMVCVCRDGLAGVWRLSVS